MRRPSGLTATELTAFWCPESRWMRSPDSRSQTATVSSRDAGDDASAVGAHRHRTHRPLVAGEPVDAGAGLEVPDRHGAGPTTPRRCVGRPGSPPPNSPILGVRRAGGCGCRNRGPRPPRSCRGSRRRCAGRRGSPPPNSPHLGGRREAHEGGGFVEGSPAEQETGSCQLAEPLLGRFRPGTPLKGHGPK